jgi:hypothetical protein
LEVLMNVTQGFLFFKDWEKSMRKLNSKDFAKIFWAMYDYQMYGKEFPEFTGALDVIASFVVPQMERRMVNSMAGKKGAEQMLKSRATEEKSLTAKGVSTGQTVCDGEACKVGESTDENGVLPMAPLQAPPQAETVAVPQTANESMPQAVSEGVPQANRKEENRIDIDIKESEIVPAADEARGTAEASPTRGDARHAYGNRKNVFLTDSEYRRLRDIIGEADTDAFIDNFSEKVYQRNYRYADHFSAISQWWQRDREVWQNDRGSAVGYADGRRSGGQASNARSRGETRNADMRQGGLERGRSDSVYDGGGSFNTDSFFEAAVMRTLMEGGLEGEKLNNAMKGVAREM